MADGESDDFKRILLEGNPVLLGVTFAVSMLHSVFDMLAFKNDIGFWKNKKNVEGLSVRTILINCVCQARPRPPARQLRANPGVRRRAWRCALLVGRWQRRGPASNALQTTLGYLPLALEACVL